MEEEIEFLDPNHSDALMDSIRIINPQVKRVIIDIGSSADILYFDVFQKLGLLTNDLTFMTSSLTKFMGNSISSLETMSIHITFGDELCSKIVMTKFNVVDIPSCTIPS